MLSNSIIEPKVSKYSDQEIPAELKKFDKIFGLEQHIWNRIYIGAITHIGFLYYLLYLFPFGHVPRWSLFLGFVYAEMCGMGTTIGCHRYWAHKAFKAKLPLQVLLMLLQTGGFQYPIFKWCRDHRVHHKYTDTNADPHNSKRGFWFSHVGWLFVPKHRDLEEKLKTVDVSDLASDPVVRFQSKYYWELVLLVSFIFPMCLCHRFFPSMSLFHLFVWNTAWYCSSLNATFCVNSVAHIWGDKPYDKYITASDSSWVSLLAVGEGWHNYHHTFPWDYKAAEFGWKLNLSTAVIDFFAWIGWAYDLKTVPPKLLADRIKRTGTNLHLKNPLLSNGLVKSNNNDAKPPLFWGWGDEQLRKEDIEITQRIFVAGANS